MMPAPFESAYELGEERQNTRTFTYLRQGNWLKELRFYVAKAREINRRFRGKHIAIIGDRVVASGKSPVEVWQRAKKTHPRSKPVLAYVPRDDALVLVLG